jgi:hypothetical protein
MPRLTKHKLESLPRYLELIERLQQKAGHPLWFRGTGKAKHLLVPSLYRHPKISSHACLQDLERQLMTRFRQRGLPYHSRDLSDDWEALFFMQHYGVPTRLLDWTENPLTGLHFALMSAPAQTTPQGRVRYEAPAAVWVLDPLAWNAIALQHVSYAGGPLTPGDEALKGYSPRSAETAMGAHPVALYGAHNSARIVAQQGVFTIFGKNQTSMDELIRKGTFPPDTLSCILVPRSRIRPMRQSLLSQGITESTVFPDLEGLARETKRHFGFEA